MPVDAFGNYVEYRETLAAQRAQLERMSPDALFEHAVYGVGVFEVCRAELMSRLIGLSPQWRNQPLPDSRRKLFTEILEINYAELIDNMAAACLWIEFWHLTTKATPRLAYVGVFSGSLTYARALLEIMRFHPGRCFVLESFFTGAHFYCEERYSPIANQSDLKLKTVFRSIGKPEDMAVFESKRNAVRDVLKKIKNKNVTQPQATGARLFHNEQPTLLIAGQVLNDFSLLETLDCGINSLETYRQVIRKVLAETDWNVIYKAHPWERKKHNLFQPLTLNELSAEFGQEARVALVEDHALTDLFKEADAVLCLNSQAGIEAALAGFKPIQLGRAFWGGHGFSHDVGHKILDDVLQTLSNPANCRLDLAAYEQLENWLVAVLDGWMIEESPGAKADARLKMLFAEIATRAPDMTIHPAGKASISDKSKAKTIATANPAASEQPRSRIFQRKLRKLINRPADFFRDAGNGVVRRIGLFVFSKAGS